MTVREAGRFVGRHLRYVPLFVALVLPAVALHELSHAVAGIAQGGTLRRIEIGPWGSGGRFWGRTWVVPPPGGWRCNACISLAPYVLWLLIGAATFAAFFLARPKDRERSLGFVLGFALMPLDALQHVSPWLALARVDFLDAFGPPTPVTLGLVLASLLAFAVAGWPLQRRAYGSHALSGGAYALLVAATALAGPATSHLLKVAAALAR